MDCGGLDVDGLQPVVVPDEAPRKVDGPLGGEAVGHVAANADGDALVESVAEVEVGDRDCVVGEVRGRAGAVVSERSIGEEDGDPSREGDLLRPHQPGRVEKDGGAVVAGRGHRGPGPPHHARPLLIEAEALCEGAVGAEQSSGDEDKASRHAREHTSTEQPAEKQEKRRHQRQKPDEQRRERAPRSSATAGGSRPARCPRFQSRGALRFVADLEATVESASGEAFVPPRGRVAGAPEDPSEVRQRCTEERASPFDSHVPAGVDPRVPVV